MWAPARAPLSIPAAYKCARESNGGWLQHHVGDQDRVAGSWLKPGPAMAIAAFWGHNQWMEELFL